MNTIQQNLQSIQASLPEEVLLVAVSKTKPVSDIIQAYNAGQRVFGENKIQEMAQKWENLPKDIRWHMIGHIQTNKVKYMAPFVHLIHAVDSIKLLKEINKQASKYNRVINCLLQIKIAEEESKYGLSKQDAFTILSTAQALEFKNVHITGLMGMATFTNNKEQINNEFRKINTIFTEFKSKYKSLTILSIGMSGDYKIALDHGSTMVRIGSSIFGVREQKNK